MRIAFVIFFLICSLSAVAQVSELKGQVLTNENGPLPYATVTLMNPSDSTMLYFAVTNNNGQWLIKNTKRGEYLFQVAYMGYNTINIRISLPHDQNLVSLLQMTPKSYNLQGADITAEYIPVLIKGDTVEYNAGAFKTNPGDVAENLLEKLPGVEVDQNGNIKAMGEDVNTVLVDGKEFFGNDPKVATKNLPAESIDKIQVYDKASEESELAGIDDADHNKTINIVLKDGQKQAWFGEMAAGSGSKEHYSTTAKVFRFTKTQQTAFLGMYNNINKAGFSLQEYISFNGGLSSVISNGGLSINSDENLPVDFGSPVNGLVKSGAGALNYSIELKPKRRLFGSYLGNTSTRSLTEQSTTEYFLEGATKKTISQNDEKIRNTAHRINIGYNDRSDSSRVVLFNASANISESGSKSYLSLLNLSGPLTLSSIDKYEQDQNDRLSVNLKGSWMKKFNGRFRLLKLKATGQSSIIPENNKWISLTSYYTPVSSLAESQRIDAKNSSHRYTFSVSGLAFLGEKIFLESSLGGSFDNNINNRNQGLLNEPFNPTDSLSSKHSVVYKSLIPDITLKRNTRKLKTQISVSAEAGLMQMFSNDIYNDDQNFLYLLPSANFEYEIKSGHRLSLMYLSGINKPTAGQLSPSANMISPNLIWYGNPYLKSEQTQNISLFWMLFDQFSQISAFARLSGIITLDKISLNRTIDDSLRQTIRLINTSVATNLEGSFEFSTPVRKAGINIGIEYSLQLDRSQNIINGILNDQSNLTHTASIRFDKRKKEKFQAGTGIEVSCTGASYSVQSNMNTTYLKYNGFAELRWIPGKRWNFALNADITNYTSSSFGEALIVPLLNASAAYSFMKFNRGTLSLEMFDLLDKNRGIERISEQNYLREIRSNTIGRFAMFTFRYRLNKAADTQDSIIIKSGS